MLSVLIPSRNIPTWPFLQKTIDDLFSKAKGDIEVIVVLDGFWPDPPLKSHENLIIIHRTEAQGMRHGINAAARIARGSHIMKCDDHCMFGEGYDVILANDCDDNWLAVPSRYALNGDTWERHYGPIDYLYLTPPHLKDDQFGWGLRGKKWMGEHGATGGYFDREKKLKDIKIDDIIAFQGSCWFMPKVLFEKIGGMQYEGYRDHQECQELSFKIWLSGGRCVVNKNTWYAHLHKGSQHGRGYHMLRHHQIQSQIYSAKIWLTNSWPGQIKTFKWLIEHPSWHPMEKWNEVDLDDIKAWENYDYSKWLGK
jgi:glycosyltransferase involved in cell wall biosynthesis